MSEIKGQLLGIVLVIAIFGVVIGILTAAFTSSAETVQSRMEDLASGSSQRVNPENNIDTQKNYSLHY